MIDICYQTSSKILRTLLLFTDFQKLQEGQLIIDIKPFNTVKWIEGVFKQYKYETKMKKLDFKLNIDQ